ncbi:MAG: hypothetical protein NT048_05545 [Flavobacterium sp.]|nr:hypothetical protein [Flavobacterium sp.]
MKYYHLITLIKHSARENEEVTLEIIFSFICIILILTIYRPDKQYAKLKEEENIRLFANKISINLIIWIGAVLGTFVTIKKILNY